MSETVALSTGLPSHIKPGLVIGGKYRLEQEIGRGSMGTVYRAVHVTLGQRVAIKLISGEHSQSLEARRRFSIEAKAAAKLRSRHVVQVYDDGETPEGNPYIVLELLEGETLEQRLERDHDVPLVDAVRIIAHVGRALARAHAQGIVHRDLKPANIFLVKTDDEEVGWIAKVLDFGIAKLDGHSEKGTTQAGTVLGTPLFMSPEQVRGASSVDHRADLYSLGMCLYHMLTSAFAFYSANYSQILIGICTLPLPSLREKAPWVPEAVEHWFQRACAKEPLERFQSADEMSEALQAAAGGAVLSKHKSFPEGRIAPETLVGYATPALATLQLDAAALGLARTQVLAQAALARPPAASIPTAIGTGERIETPSQWTTPIKSLRIIWLGLGLGVLAVVAGALTLTFLGGGEPQSSRTTQSKPTYPSDAVPRPTSEPAAAPAKAAAVTEEHAAAMSTGSSVAAATMTPLQRRKLLGAKKQPAAPVARPKQAGEAPAAPNTLPGSDLGF